MTARSKSGPPTPLQSLGIALAEGELPDAFPWGGVTLAARRARLEPLLWYRRAREIPPEFHERLVSQSRRVAFATVIAERELRAILRAFGEAKVGPVVLLKGAVLGPLVYPSAALRSTNDIDLLVGDRQIGAAAEALESIGYVATDLFPGRAASGVAYHERLLSREVVPGKVRQPVELHTGFAQAFRHRLDMEGFIRRAVRFPEGGDGALRLDDVDQLLHLAVHLAREQFLSPAKHLYDVHLWGRRGVNWDDVIERAGLGAIRTAVFETLRLSGVVFGTEVPPGVLRELAPGRVRGWWLGEVHRPTGDGLIRSRMSMRRAQVLAMMPLLDDGRDRLRAVVGYGWLRWADRRGRTPDGT